MSARNLKTHSETDWARVDSMTDEEIDTSDIPPLDDAFSTRAGMADARKENCRHPKRGDDVLKWFEAQGADFQHRINAALRIYAEAHQE